MVVFYWALVTDNTISFFSCVFFFFLCVYPIEYGVMRIKAVPRRMISRKWVSHRATAAAAAAAAAAEETVLEMAAVETAASGHVRKQCQHGKVSPRCKICHPSHFCEHNKIKSECIECTRLETLL
jgi:hypothetical protein